jgi:hypothetical protein
MDGTGNVTVVEIPRRSFGGRANNVTGYTPDGALQIDGGDQATRSLWWWHKTLAPSAAPSKRPSRSPTVSFEGMSQIVNLPNGYAPPDAVGDVSYTQYVQMVNDAIAVFSKTGLLLAGPVPLRSFFAPLATTAASDCAMDNGDPVVLHDQFSDRWIAMQFAVTAAPFYICLAVSRSNDATGGWNFYAFSTGTLFPDYPKMSVWRDSLVVTTVDFDGVDFVGVSSMPST